MINMDERPLITLEQLTLLMQQGEEKQKELAEMITGLMGDGLGSERVMDDNANAFDYTSVYELKRQMKTLQMIEKIQGNYRVVTPQPYLDYVQIGSQVELIIDYGNNDYDTNSVTIIQKRYCNESPELFISCDTELGINLLGKKIGDEIQFLLPSGVKAQAKVLGIINNIGQKYNEVEKTR